MRSKNGMIYVFEGNGKGKTSAALGVATRMLLLKKRVVWISWFKETRWKIAEMKLADVFKENLKMYWMGKGFYGGNLDHDTPYGHKKAAGEAFSLAKSILTYKKGVGGMVDLLVLDEIIRAVGDELLSVEDVISLVKMRGNTHLVLTGHNCPGEIREVADLVTEMRKVKHPYDKGVLAIPGLDF